MKVTPLDIRRKEFKRSMRGYADEEVDIFLDEVADEFERLYQENAEMQDRLQRLEEQLASHAQLKEALEKTLVSAQLQADQVTANARKESELIMRDAELKARDIVSESYSETQRVQQSLVQLKHLEEDFRFKFRSLLEAHLKLLNDAPIAVRGPEAAVLAPALPSDAAALTPADVRTSREASTAEPAAGAAPTSRDEPSGAAGVAASTVAPGLVPDAEAIESLPEASAATPEPAASDAAGATEPPRTAAGPEPYGQVDAEAGAEDAGPTLSGAAIVPPPGVDAQRPERTVTYRRLRVDGEVRPQSEAPAPETGSGARQSSIWPVDDSAEQDGRSILPGAALLAADDDVPTQETELPARAVADEAAAETPPAETYHDGSEERPVRGFFFGRQVDDLDDSFVTSETIKNEKGRDFEW